MEKISVIIRQNRIKKNLTQAELGKLVFVSKQAVSKWETGKTMPDIETIQKLCAILEIDKDEILGGSIATTNHHRKWLNICVVASVICLIIAAFFALDDFGYIDRYTQAGIAYVSVYRNGTICPTNRYQISIDIPHEDLKNGYKLDSDYGELRGVILLDQEYNIEFGFNNTNNWHNIRIRLDITEHEGQTLVRQSIEYETDNHLYNVLQTDSISAEKSICVFREGL